MITDKHGEVSLKRRKPYSFHNDSTPTREQMQGTHHRVRALVGRGYERANVVGLVLAVILMDLAMLGRIMGNKLEEIPT